jgi:hypothetical protein
MGTPELLEAAERVPHVAPLQPAPLSDHRTLLLRRDVVTVAVNGCVPPGVATVAVFGKTVTVLCAATLETKTRTQQANRTNAASKRRTKRRGDAAGMSGQPPAMRRTEKGHAISTGMATVGWVSEGIVAERIKYGE